uniref:Uncharacterized protein n=1 Tax=Arundo donax TaxID=35708 RepID=A0A0A9C966_ARUDO
MGSVHLARQQL